MEIKTNKKNKSISLAEDVITDIDNYAYLDQYDFSKKIEIMAAEYMKIVDLSLSEIKDLFSDEEFNILGEACRFVPVNSLELTPVFIITTAYTSYCTYYKILLREELLDKINTLTSAQAMALFRFIDNLMIKK